MKWMYDSARNRGFMNDRALEALAAYIYGWTSIRFMVAFGTSFIVSLILDVSEPFVFLPFALTISAGLIAAYHFYDALVCFRGIRKKAWFIRSGGTQTFIGPHGVKYNIEYAEYSQGLEE